MQVLSDSAMAGYLPDEATAAAFADGWYRTGDVGWLEPEGWVHLTDRSKEMIKVSGFQVAPAEIEAVLHGHPAVIDCAVFGVPDERAGEVPVAAVQLEPGSDVTADDLAQLVTDTLATYKRLHHVVLVDAVPRTPSGKVLRRTLRDEWLRPLAAAAPTDGRPPLARAGRPARCRGAGGRSPRRARRCRARRPRACRQARRRSARLRLARAAHGDRRRDALGLGGRGRARGRGARPRPRRCRLPRCDPGRRARRRAGAPAAGGAETVALRADLGELATDEGGHVPPGALALDAGTAPARSWASAAPTAGPSAWSRSIRPPPQHRPAASTSPGPSRRVDAPGTVAAA